MGPSDAVAVIGEGADVAVGADEQVPKQSDPHMHFSSLLMEGPQGPQAVKHAPMALHPSAVSSPHVVRFVTEPLYGK